MMLKGTEDLRVRKTIEAIHRTFEKMICEMDYEKITVKELCERALINKKTFYRYYVSLDELLSELQNMLSQEFLKKIENYRIPEDLDQINRAFFLYSVERGAVFDKITCSGSYYYIHSELVTEVMSSTWGQSACLRQLSPAKQEILLEYIQKSSIAIYRKWVADGKKIPLDDIIEMSNRLLCSGVNGFIEHN